MTAAQAWIAAAVEHAGSAAAVARVVGEAPQAIGRYARGEVDAASGKVADWDGAWRAAGWPDLGLRLAESRWATGQAESQP